MEDTYMLTSSQKRNRRRTISKLKKRLNNSESRIPIHSRGHAVMVEHHCLTDMGRPYLEKYKAFIHAYKYKENGNFSHYICRNELPIDIMSSLSIPHGIEYDGLRESRKKYSEEELKQLICYLANRDIEWADRCIKDYCDYTIVMEKEIKKYCPFNGESLIPRNCLRHYWCYQKKVAIGKGRIITDKKIIREFMNRKYPNSWGEDPTQIIEVELHLFSFDINRSRTEKYYMLDCVRRSDTEYPFRDGFYRARGERNGSRKQISELLGETFNVMVKFHINEENKTLIPHTWRVICDELVQLFLYIIMGFTIPVNEVPYMEYLNITYQNLPSEEKDRFSSLMWARDCKYVVHTDKRDYRNEKQLLESD